MSCSAPCSTIQLPVATWTSGGQYDTTIGGAMVSLVPDNSFSDELLLTIPFLNNVDNNFVMLAFIVNAYPVNDVYFNNQNLNVRFLLVNFSLH